MKKTVLIDSYFSFVFLAERAKRKKSWWRTWSKSNQIEEEDQKEKFEEEKNVWGSTNTEKINKNAARKWTEQIKEEEDKKKKYIDE